MSPSDHALCEALLNAFDAGVLVVRRDGTIVMHNQQAVQLLPSPTRATPTDPVKAQEAPSSEAASGAGQTAMAGASVYAYVNRELLRAAFRHATDRGPGDGDATTAVFATAPRADQLLRVKVSPVPATNDHAERFVLHLRPIAPWSEADTARHRFLQALAEGLRDPLASVRAAIETMAEYPSMDDSVAAQFRDIILEQSVVLSERLDEALETYAAMYRTRWPLDDMVARDLLALLQVRLGEQLDVPVEVMPDGATGGTLRIRVDAQALTAGVLFLAQRLANATQYDRLRLRMNRVRRAVALDLGWDGGEAVSQERLAKWTTETVYVGDTIIAMTLRDILDRHDAEIWMQEGAGATWPHVRVALPLAQD